jgi:hypothetical protein
LNRFLFHEYSMGCMEGVFVCGLFGEICFLFSLCAGKNSWVGYHPESVAFFVGFNTSPLPIRVISTPAAAVRFQ